MKPKDLSLELKTHSLELWKTPCWMYTTLLFLLLAGIRCSSRIYPSLVTTWWISEGYPLITIISGCWRSKHFKWGTNTITKHRAAAGHQVHTIFEKNTFSHTVVLNSSGLVGICLNPSKFHLGNSGSLGLKSCALQLEKHNGTAQHTINVANKCWVLAIVSIAVQFSQLHKAEWTSNEKNS